MPKRVSASRLLRQFIEAKKSSKQRARLYGLLGQEQTKLTYLNEPLQRAIHAHRALTLFQSDHALKKAFKAFSLDPRNPYDWRTLLTYFAEAHFGATRGAPKKWTFASRAQFLQDFLRVRVHHPTASIQKICELMRSDKSMNRKYKSVPVGTLRKQHRNALKEVLPAEYRKPRSRIRRKR
jgi:hypothetical protein